MKRNSILLFVAATLAAANFANAQTPVHLFENFRRPAESKPVIIPDRNAEFFDPILQTKVHWEALHTFNPAAVVRGNSVNILYRAEDDRGVMQIGKHTS